MINSPSRSEAEDEDDLFYFESDHLALKGNKDYSELLKTLFILQAQQQKAIKVSFLVFVQSFICKNNIFMYL